MKFLDLVVHISEGDGSMRLVAGRSLQQVLSLRNWLSGASRVEFEQAGEDRAAYGQRLIAGLADALGDAGCQGLSRSNLENARQVALAYPGLDLETLARSEVLPVPSFGQTSGKGAGGTEIRQTYGESSTPFPSPARRAAEQQELPWRDAAWVARLFAELDLFPHPRAVAHRRSAPPCFLRGSLPKRALGSARIAKRARHHADERIGLSESRDEVLVLALAREGTVADAPAAQLERRQDRRGSREEAEP